MAEAAALDARHLRRAFSTYGTGVAIVTTLSAKGDPVGLTVNSFASLSLDPPLVLWSQSRSALSHPVFAKASHFVVNVLASEHRELAERFATPGIDRFAGLDCGRSQAGLPLIAGAAAHFECRREALHEAGDHAIIVGRIERYAYVRKPTLLFCHGAYHEGTPPPG